MTLLFKKHTHAGEIRISNIPGIKYESEAHPVKSVKGVIKTNNL